MNKERMEAIGEWYIRRAWIPGLVYFSVPTALIFAYVFYYDPFRSVYLLRLLLCLVIGGPIAAVVHHYGINLWVIKHRSGAGPATVRDGMAIGGAVALYMTLVPPLFSLIKTNHLEQVKWFIIIMYLSMFILGACLGGFVAFMGRRYIKR